jgi:hypothetical protein
LPTLPRAIQYTSLREKEAMKQYNIYVPSESANGSDKIAAESWSWLEDLLRKQFGRFRKSIGFHDGTWPKGNVSFEGKVNAYSLVAEQEQARPFFKHLKQQAKKHGQPEVVIVEGEVPGPKGEPAGERI